MTQENLTEEQEFEKKKEQVLDLLSKYGEEYMELYNIPIMIDRIIEDTRKMPVSDINWFILNFFLKHSSELEKEGDREERAKKERIFILVKQLKNIILYDKEYEKDVISYTGKYFKEIEEYLNNQKKDLDSKINSEIDRFNKLNDILKNEKTYEIYEKEEFDNKKQYQKYIKRSVRIAVGGVGLSFVNKMIFSICWFGKLCFLEDNSIDYWIMKASIIFIAITGVTLCLKQAIHHQKKRDLAEKNRLELEALPTYMTYFNDEMKTEIYKDLLPKYFGQPIDNTHYTNMNSLIDEQLKLSNEILKSQLNKIGANSDSSTESKSKS